MSHYICSFQVEKITVGENARTEASARIKAIKWLKRHIQHYIVVKVIKT